MALIEHGSIAEFSARFADASLAGTPGFRLASTLGEVREARRGLRGADLELTKSKERRGLALKSLTLNEGFEGFMGNLFDPTNEVYFLAWAWDMSGEPPFQYPGANAGPKTAIIPMRVGKMRSFLGEGALLFPPRVVSAGLAVRLMLWESDAGQEAAAQTFTRIGQTIQTSKLSSALTLIAATGFATAATIGLAVDAAGELAKLVGALLSGGSDDYVDFYEGYYSAGTPWRTGDERYDGNSSTIVLHKMAEPVEDYV